MNWFRKCAAGVLLAMLVLSVTACGNSGKDTTDKGTNTENTTDGTDKKDNVMDDADSGNGTTNKTNTQ